MQLSFKLTALSNKFVLALGITSVQLLFASATEAQSLSDSAAPPQSTAPAAEDADLKLQTFPIIAPSLAEKQPTTITQFQPSTQAADLQPAHLSNLVVSQSTSSSEPAPESQQSDQDLLVPLGGGATKSFSFGLGSRLREPTALQGPTRDRIVLSGEQSDTSFSVTPYLQWRPAANQRLNLEGSLGLRELGFDLSYAIAPKVIPGEFSINFFDQVSRVPAFEEGDREVNLPNGDVPWVQRLGGGIEYYRPLTPQFSAAVGASYQTVSVRDGVFTSDLFPVDQIGDSLTVSRSGQDDLLTLNLAALYSTVNNYNYPTRGTRIRFGLDQAVPVGDASILFTRLSANVSRFIPLNLLRFSEGSDVLVLNLQGGTMVGDVPPYEAYTLGGDNSVRGFEGGGVGSGRSFIQTTAEYRFPVTSLRVFQTPIAVAGNLFFDYGTNLGTQSTVIGRPGVVREKPGAGLGYGFGLLFNTPFSLFRLGLGFNDRGDTVIHATAGDRF